MAAESPRTPRFGNEWRVYRYEHRDGRYLELATNEMTPEEITLPPSAKGYRFVRSTRMAPVEPLLDLIRWLIVNDAASPPPVHARLDAQSLLREYGRSNG